MRHFAVICALVLAIHPAVAGPAASDSLEIALAHRLFPVLTDLRKAGLTPAAKEALAARRARYEDCREEPACILAAAEWSDPEIDAVAGTMQNDSARAAIRRELVGVNAVLAVYGKGAPSRYPAIDGPSAKPDSARFKANLGAAILLSGLAQQGPGANLDLSLSLAVALLDANNRVDAVAFDPLDSGDNAAAFQRAHTIAWTKFPYTAIIVLGVGPDDPTVALSAGGKVNVHLAAQRYQEGLAPFIIVSGGTAHPRETRFVEAVEMRRALIERFHIPADAIVIEPYARHTTTNLRNATRLLMAMKAPLTRDALVVSNPKHIAGTASPEFAARSQRELGYQPGVIGKQVLPTAVAFRPSAASAQIDPLDPLDP